MQPTRKLLLWSLALVACTSETMLHVSARLVPIREFQQLRQGQTHGEVRAVVGEPYIQHANGQTTQWRYLVNRPSQRTISERIFNEDIPEEDVCDGEVIFLAGRLQTKTLINCRHLSAERVAVEIAPSN